MPKPGPTSATFLPFSARSTLSSSFAAEDASTGVVIASTTRDCSAATASVNVAMVTEPAPARRAPSLAIHAAPSVPGVPQNSTTCPTACLCVPTPRGTIQPATSLGSRSSATASTPVRKRGGAARRNADVREVHGAGVLGALGGVQADLARAEGDGVRRTNGDPVDLAGVRVDARREIEPRPPVYRKR